MLKKIFLLSLFINYLFFQSLILYSKKNDSPKPDLIWEYKAPGKSYIIPEFNQPNEGREFYIFRNEDVKFNQKKLDFLIVDTQTGRLKREYEIRTTEDKLKLFSTYCRDKYFIRAYPGKLDFYILDTMKFLYSIKQDFENVTFDIYAEKKLLILNNPEWGKYNTLTFHNLDTGREIFSVKYEYSSLNNKSFSTPYYIVYEESDTIAILENGKDFTMYNLLDGSIKGKVKNGIKGEFFQTFGSEKDDEMYIITSEPYYLRKVNIKTGKLLSEVKFKKSGVSEIGFTLNEIDGLVYLTYQDETLLNSNGLACIDIEKNEVVWEKKLQTAHLINIISQEDDIVTFDNKTVYRLNKKTGKEIWSVKLNDPKVVRKEREGLLIGLGLGKTPNLSEEIGYSGFVLLNEKTGEIKWQFNVEKKECISNLIYNIDNEYVYFADTSTFYILNPRTGELVVKKEINIKNEISSSLYIKEKNQMLFITRNSVVLYDIKTEKVLYETNIKDAIRIYFLYEAKLIGDYLIFTGIVPLRTGYFGSMSGPVMRTLLNVNTGEIIWSTQIGVNHYVDTNGLAYYVIIGTQSAGSYTNSMFWPRRDLFEENLFVMCEPYDPDFVMMDYRLKGYKVFPDDAKPSSSEIKNAITIFGIHNKVLGSSYLKRLLAGMNDLWEKE